MSLANEISPSPATAPIKRDGLGCTASRLRKDLHIGSGDLQIYRKGMDDARAERVSTEASDRGFLAGIALQGGHRRHLFRGARSEERRFDSSSIYLRDFSEPYSAELHGDFDFVLVELSPEFLTRLADEHDSPVIRGLTCSPRKKDPVLYHLASALAATTDASGPLNKLFVDHVGLCIGIHIARQYGNFAHHETQAKGTLTPAQEARAKELLLLRSDSGNSIGDIASECHLSRAYFIRAFARTTGRTPHQWLLEQRVTEARVLIETTEKPLAEIAMICGFSDQSHLSRVFLKLCGATPGAWRRAARR
jgi:AraC-like DNA-binding protein